MTERLEPFDVYAPVADVLNKTMQAKFDDRKQRAKVVKTLVRWLVFDAKKKALPNLDQRIADWSGRIEKMVENMELDFSGGELVVRVSGSDEQTLKALQFGSSWFEPNNDLMETIWVGLFET